MDEILRRSAFTRRLRLRIHEPAWTGRSPWGAGAPSAVAVRHGWSASACLAPDHPDQL